MIEYVIPVVTNITIQILAKIPESILSLVTLKVLTKHLSVEEFGIYSFAVAYISIFSPICDAGMTPIVTREVSKDKNKASLIIGNATILRSFLVVIYILVVFFSTFVMKEKIKRFVVISLLLSFLFYPLSTINSIFYSELKVWILSIGNILKKIIFLGLFLVFLQFNLRLVNTIVSYIICENFIVIFLFIIALKYIKPVYRYSFNLSKFILAESIPLFLTIFVSMLYTKVDTVMLSFLTNNYMVGIYNAALQFYNFIFFIPAVINSVFYPLMSKHFGKKGYSKISLVGISVSCFVGIVTMICCLLIAEFAVLKILSEKYVDTVKIFKILSLGIPFAFCNIIMGNLLISAARQRNVLLFSLITSGVNIFLNTIFIPKYLAIGAAYATFLTQVCGIVLYSASVAKVLIGARR